MKREPLDHADSTGRQFRRGAGGDPRAGTRARPGARQAVGVRSVRHRPARAGDLRAPWRHRYPPDARARVLRGDRRLRTADRTPVPGRLAGGVHAAARHRAGHRDHRPVGERAGRLLRPDAAGRAAAAAGTGACAQRARRAGGAAGGRAACGGRGRPGARRRGSGARLRPGRLRGRRRAQAPRGTRGGRRSRAVAAGWPACSAPTGWWIPGWSRRWTGGANWARRTCPTRRL